MKEKILVFTNGNLDICEKVSIPETLVEEIEVDIELAERYIEKGYKYKTEIRV